MEKYQQSKRELDEVVLQMESLVSCSYEYLNGATLTCGAVIQDLLFRSSCIAYRPIRPFRTSRLDRQTKRLCPHIKVIYSASYTIHYRTRPPFFRRPIEDIASNPRGMKLYSSAQSQAVRR